MKTAGVLKLSTVQRVNYKERLIWGASEDQFSYSGIAVTPSSDWILAAYQQGMLLFSSESSKHIASMRYSDTEQWVRHCTQFVSESMAVVLTDKGRISSIEIDDDQGGIKLREVDTMKLNARVNLSTGKRFHTIQLAGAEDNFQAKYVCFLAAPQRESRTMFAIKIDHSRKKPAGLAQLEIPSLSFEVNAADELVTAINAALAFAAWYNADHSRDFRTISRVELDKLSFK